MTGFTGTFTPAQHKQLLAPIRPQRVLKDGKGFSHVSQQDITAHLIRVFGFGNFATELLALDCIFETPRSEKVDASTRYNVAYRAHMRLTIFDEHHNQVTSFEDASIGDAQNQTRADAHDLAMKSAISLAKKRCTINLGDQFGLSLYNKGQMSALVLGTLVSPGAEVAEHSDVQADVPQQESMGHDETERVVPGSEPTAEHEQRLAESLGAKVVERQVAPAGGSGEQPPEDVPKEVQVEDPPTQAGDEPLGITGPQHAKIGALLKEAGITGRDEAIAKVVGIIGRSIASRNDLNRVEASKVIATLEES